MWRLQAGCAPVGGLWDGARRERRFSPVPGRQETSQSPAKWVWRAISAADLLVALGTGAVCVTHSLGSQEAGMASSYSSAELLSV